MTRTQWRLKMSRHFMHSILFDNPIETTAQIVFGPALQVTQIQLLADGLFFVYQKQNNKQQNKIGIFSCFNRILRMHFGWGFSCTTDDMNWVEFGAKYQAKHKARKSSDSRLHAKSREVKWNSLAYLSPWHACRCASLNDNVAGVDVKSRFPARLNCISALFASVNKSIQKVNTLFRIVVQEAQIDFVTGDSSSVVQRQNNFVLNQLLIHRCQTSFETTRQSQLDPHREENRGRIDEQPSDADAEQCNAAKSGEQHRKENRKCEQNP